MSSLRIESNADFQFEWTKSFFLQIRWIILKSFSFNFLLFSSDLMNWYKPLQTNWHLQRLLTSRLIRMFCVMWLNPWFVKISSNILEFVLILIFPAMRSMGKWQLFSWNKKRLCRFWKNITVIYFLRLRFAGNAQLFNNHRNSSALKKAHLNLVLPESSHASLNHFEIICNKYYLSLFITVSGLDSML